MSLKDFQQNFDSIIKQLDEILSLLKNQQNTDNVKNNIEATASKIINEIKTLIHDCPCNKEILEALNQRPSKDKQIIPVDDDISKSTSGLKRYSYPNFSVGNEELGTGKNPGSLTWPFRSNLE